MYGQVIGVTEASYPNGENLNLAVPINWLKTLDTSLNMTLEQVYQKEYGSVPSSLPAPTLISPANNSVISTTTPILTWTAVSGADYYTVAVMKGSVINPDNLVWWADKSYSNSISVPSGYLVSGETYTWVVAAHNSSGYGAGSDAWHFSIAQAQLTAPALLSPNDEESLLEKGLIFSWSPVPGAVKYGFWVGLGLSGDNSTKVYSQTVYGTSFSIPAGILPTGKIYTWAVCALDQNNNPVWSFDRHFSVIHVTEPVLLYPTNYSTIYTNPTMIWLPMSGADHYELYLHIGTSILNNPPILTQEVYGTSYQLPAYTLTHGLTYCWWVSARSGNYTIGLSHIYVFTVAP
jgi:hypothetical protein